MRLEINYKGKKKQKLQTHQGFKKKKALLNSQWITEEIKGKNFLNTWR